MRRSLATLALAAALALLAHGAAAAYEGDTVDIMMASLLNSDLIGAATITSSTANGVHWPLTNSVGLGGLAKDKFISTDSCVNMNSMVEVLVAVAAITLQNDVKFAGASLDQALSTTHTPRGLSFGTITYTMLLTHTSTITDVDFSASEATAPTVVGTLAAFVEGYFVTSGALNAGVFDATIERAGSAAAYQHARANTALLAYILEKALVGKGLTLKQYISQEILVKFGMHSTFFLEPNGAPPGVMPHPAFTGTYSSPASATAASYADFFSGCIVDRTTASVTTHPAFAADFMAITTAADIERLAHNLFLTTAFDAVAQTMKGGPVLLATETNGIVGRGRGLMFFNGDTLCAGAIRNSVINQCPVSNLTTVVGYASARGSTRVGFFCTDSTASGKGLGVVCVTVVNVHSGTSGTAYDNMFALAAVSFQEAFGTVVVQASPTTAPRREGMEAEWFGVYVFLGFFLTVCFIVFGTMVIQYLLIPPSLSVVTNTQTAGGDQYGKPNPNAVTGPGVSPPRGGAFGDASPHPD
jgi:hypothetical protein